MRSCGVLSVKEKIYLGGHAGPLGGEKITASCELGGCTGRKVL